MANTGCVVIIATITVILAVLGRFPATEAEQLTDHQRMVLTGGGVYGKRSQTGMRPVNYLNLVDEGQDSDELQKDQVGSSLALFLARLSPEKRHILSQLLAMPRMNNDNTDE